MSQSPQPPAVAYFDGSRLKSAIPTYSGGLGILAGRLANLQLTRPHGWHHSPSPQGLFSPAPDAHGNQTEVRQTEPAEHIRP
jgi:hypothetical protein